MAFDWSPFVGLPWRDRGRGPAGYDCWGLLRLAFAAGTGIELPSYADGYRSAADRDDTARVLAGEVGDWNDVTNQQPNAFDAAVMIVTGRLHIGLVVRSGQILHMPFRGTSVIAPASRLPTGEVFRHKKLIGARRETLP